MTSRQEIATFLMSATLGADQSLLDLVDREGRDVWLDRQLAAPLSADDRFERTTEEIWRYFRERLLIQHGEAAINGDGNNPALPYKWYFRMAWWQRCLSLDATSDHLLRHRIALALSEILVISDQSQLELDAIGMASFYDLLYRHAFGSYATLLAEVSMHPCMGVYLSHMNNRKADPANNIHPDENYAREIMQLFSIGLYQLNPDGSHRSGDLPSYNNEDIREMARVFTGLKAAEYRYEWPGEFFPYNGTEIHFDDQVGKENKMPPFVTMTAPMKIDERFHDRGPKKLLQGHINLPGDQDGETEIREVARRLTAHPNTGPFIARKLIQQLTHSNPSKSYIRAVAEAFGSEGDLAAMIKAILRHPEARKPQKLKSPLLRATQILRAFNVGNASGRIWITGEFIQSALEQHPLSSPSVFNFYKPDYAPHGPISRQGLIAPEFELHHSVGAISYLNSIYAWIMGGYLPLVSTRPHAELPNVPELEAERLYQHIEDVLKLDFSRWMEQARKPEDQPAMIDQLTVLLTGQERPALRETILSSIEYFRTEPEWVVKTAVFFISASADFAVLEA